MNKLKIILEKAIRSDKVIQDCNSKECVKLSFSSAFSRIICAFFLLFGQTTLSYANLTVNQTDEVSPVIVGAQLPFDVEITLMPTQLPSGAHSGSFAVYNGKWVFIGGRTNGVHGFSATPGNFPPAAQNPYVFVVDPSNWQTWSRSLYDITSGLTQAQIDLLTVTSPQFYQPKPAAHSIDNQTLYITGGYGVDTLSGLFSTKPILTAINLPGLINWVITPSSGTSAAQFIRQISHPIFQVTGGYMNQLSDDEPILLVFGQNFDGFYSDSSNGNYTEQIRRFWINDSGKDLSVNILSSKPSTPNSNFRRRDLNVAPIIRQKHGHYKKELVAFSGVFTLNTGVWTVPVEIKPNGSASMANPLKSSTFKQGMNNYICAHLGLFSKSAGDMYTVLFGGITFGFFENGVFMTDSEFPFTNSVTTIQIDDEGNYTQYLLNGSYPEILSTQSNPTNPLLFGAGAFFIRAAGTAVYGNDVLNLDAITEPTVVGYIVGGIQSTVPNTNPITDSAASPYIFQVKVIPQ